MKRVALMGAVTVVLAVSCGKLDCQPRTVTVTGDLHEDVIGSWDGFGVDSRVVFTLLRDGGLTFVEEPNMYAVGGNQSRGGYQVTDGGVDLGAYGLYRAEVSASELTLTDDAGYTRTHAALSCHGPGFE